MFRNLLLICTAWLVAVGDVGLAQSPQGFDAGWGVSQKPVFEIVPVARYAELLDDDNEVVPPGLRRPPEPPSADWGSYERPQSPSTSSIPQDSVLAGPPKGILQRPWGLMIRSFLRPEQVFSTDRAVYQPFDFGRPDAIAPAGVFGDHTLPAGGYFLFSYRHIAQRFSGNLDGTQSVSNADIFKTFTAAPQNMTIDRDYVQFEYAPSDDLTIMTYFQYIQNTIRYSFADGGKATINFNNLGDIPIYALYRLRQWDRQQIHLNIGLNIPVGFLDSTTHVPAPGSLDMAYPQRTSSGTFDFLPGITYRGQSDRWSWGTQTSGTVRMGTNYVLYRPGDEYDLTSWLQRRIGKSWSLSTRFDGRWRGNNVGTDARLTPTLAPTLNSNYLAGTTIDLLFGVNYYLPRPWPFSHYLSLESGFPVYQNLTGPQLAEQWLLNFSYNLLY